MIINFAMHEKMLICRKITGADPELTCYDNVQELYLLTDDDGEGTTVCGYCMLYLLGLPITPSIINSTNQLRQKWTAWSKNHHQSPKSFPFK